MKRCYIRVMARSNLGTRLQLSLSAVTDDLRGLISDALAKIAQYSSSEESFLIEYIDSVSHLRDLNE